MAWCSMAGSWPKIIWRWIRMTCSGLNCLWATSGWTSSPTFTTFETGANMSRETRFRTVPAKLDDSMVASLKRVVGTVFPRSPYEIWPLLSSPCDMFSLGVIAVRVLLANSRSNLPVVLDETLSLSRLLGKPQTAEEVPAASLHSLLQKEERLLDLVSPHSLTESNDTPAQARSKIHLKLWIETIAIVLRLFPRIGPAELLQGFWRCFTSGPGNRVRCPNPGTGDIAAAASQHLGAESFRKRGNRRYHSGAGRLRNF